MKRERDREIEKKRTRKKEMEKHMTATACCFHSAAYVLSWMLVRLVFVCLTEVLFQVMNAEPPTKKLKEEVASAAAKKWLKIDLHNHILPETWPDLKEVRVFPLRGQCACYTAKDQERRMLKK